MSRWALPLVALVVPVFSGACYYPDAGDPFAGMHTGDRHAHNRRWILVKYRAGSTSAETWAHQEKEIVSFDRDVNESGIRAAPAPGIDTEFASILIREGDSGFLAVARGEPVRRFTLGGRSYGGGTEPVDRGFEISPRVLGDGRIAAVLAPAFLGLDPGDARAELRVRELAFGIELEERATVMLTSERDAKDEVVRAIFDRPRAGEDARAHGAFPALWLRAEVVR